MTHERIWLQVDPEGDRFEDDEECSSEGVTWCQDKINETDVGYVRLDKFEELKAELAAARKVIEVADKAILHPLAVNCAAYYAARKGTT